MHCSELDLTTLHRVLYACSAADSAVQCVVHCTMCKNFYYTMCVTNGTADCVVHTWDCTDMSAFSCSKAGSAVQTLYYTRECTDTIYTSLMTLVHCIDMSAFVEPPLALCAHPGGSHNKTMMRRIIMIFMTMKRDDQVDNEDNDDYDDSMRTYGQFVVK